MESYSIDNGWGISAEPPEVEAWNGNEGDGWGLVWSLDEVRVHPGIEIQMWRHDDYPHEVYVTAAGEHSRLCLVECPTFGDALQCVTQILPLARAAAAEETLGLLEEFVGLTKAALVDRGIPLPR